MTTKLIAIFILFSSMHLFGQVDVEQLKEMPEAVSNNAIAVGSKDGKQFVYSFGGIDTSKLYNGIHEKVFRYSVNDDEWSILPDLPSGAGRIASAASTVKNKIYIIGGYQVLKDGSEITLKNVHVFNPETNEFDADAMDIPTAIDDHVQVVWRDSLIFVITGWSKNKNVNKIQIYNPSDNTWQRGTSVPSNSSYMAFGASGTIVGDTIYYLGGATGGSGFPAAITLRIGAINPDDPTSITWTNRQLSTMAYRAAASNYLGAPIWIGGSEVTYNFDGVAFNGSGVVSPSINSLKVYDKINRDFENYSPLSLMDLRGVAKINEHEFIVCGGMKNGTIVTDEVKKITLSFLTENQDLVNDIINIYPNPSQGMLQLEKPFTGHIEFYDSNGKLVVKKHIFDSSELNMKVVPPNIYFLQFYNEEGVFVFKQKIIILK